MPWAPAAAGISAAAGIAGSAMSSNAVSEASDKATQAELQMYSQTREDLSPYREAGTATLTQQQNLLGLNGQAAADTAMQTYQQSPGYQWQLSEGLRATDAGAAAKGMLRSGAALKAEQTYGQGLANTDFTNYYNRLSALTTTGANAAAQQATSNTNTADSLSNISTGEGTQQSSIYSNATSGLSSTINNLFNNKGFQSWLSGSGSNDGGSGGIYNAPGTPVYNG